MSTIAKTRIKPAVRPYPTGYKAARPTPVVTPEPPPRELQDFATDERKAYIHSVDPCINRQERRYYFWRLVLAVALGLRMPYERRHA